MPYGFDDDAVANGPARDSVTHFSNLPRELVPGRHGGRGREGAVVEVQVRATDPAGADADQHVARGRLRDVRVPKLDLLLAGAVSSGHPSHIGGHFTPRSH